MFCGKTEELIRRIRRTKIAKQKVIVFKVKKDVRYEEFDPTDIVGHDGSRFSSIPVDTENTESVLKMIDLVREADADVVAIDEGNLFPMELVEVCETLAGMNKRVIVAGLDLNFRGEPFDPMPQLMARAEKIDKLSAICVKCGARATRTQRIIEGKPAKYDDPLIVIGKDDKYEARCRRCHVVVR